MVQCKNSWFLFLTSWYSYNSEEVTHNHLNGICISAQQPRWNQAFSRLRPTFSNVRFDNLHFMNSELTVFILHQDLFFWILTNLWNFFHFILFHYCHLLLTFFSCCHLRRKTLKANLTTLFVWRSASEKLNEKIKPFCFFVTSASPS